MQVSVPARIRSLGADKGWPVTASSPRSVASARMRTVPGDAIHQALEGRGYMGDRLDVLGYPATERSATAWMVQLLVRGAVRLRSVSGSSARVVASVSSAMARGSWRTVGRRRIASAAWSSTSASQHLAPAMRRSSSGSPAPRAAAPRACLRSAVRRRRRGANWSTERADTVGTGPTRG